jgi:hypothetical protein
MTLSIPIRSRLEGNRKTVLTRRVTIRWTTLTSRKRRGNLIRRRRHIGRRGEGISSEQEEEGTSGEYPE